MMRKFLVSFVPLLILTSLFQTPSDAQDITPPTVTINTPTGTQTEAFTVTVIFSEAVTGFIQDELVVTGTANATITAWTPQTGGTNYDATITPKNDGSVILNVAADVAEDAATNGNTAASEQTVQVLIPETVWMPDANLRDMVREELSIADDDTLTQAAMLNLTALEEDSSFVFDQIQDLTGIEYATKLTKLDLDQHAISSLTPLTSMTQLIELSLINNQVSDISPLAGLTSLTKLSFESNSISDLTPLEGLTELTELNLRENAISDISPLEDLVKLTTLNLRQKSRPSSKISDITVLENLTALTHLILENNNPSDLSKLEGLSNLTYLSLRLCNISSISSLADLTSLTYLHIGNNRINDLTPLAKLTNLNDLFLINNPAVTVFPTVEIAIPAGTQNSAFEVTITFSEKVSAFVQADLSVSGGGATITNWVENTEGLEYTATITPTTDGTVNIEVAEGVAQGFRKATLRQLYDDDDVDIDIFFQRGFSPASRSDLNDPNKASDTQMVAVDMTSPTVSIEIPSAVQVGPFDVKVVFNEPVTDFVQSELVMTGSTAGTSITNWDPKAGGEEYVATITPTQRGIALFSVSADVAVDAANNKNTASTQVRVPVDTSGPQVFFDVPTNDYNNIQNGPFDVAIYFAVWNTVTSQYDRIAVTGFVQSEFEVTGTASASITDWTSETGGSDYIATLTPTKDGTIILNVDASVAEDRANNDNLAATETTVHADITRPSVTLSLHTTSLSGVYNAPFQVKIGFSEEVTGFEQAELVVTGTADASITNWEVNEDIYYATITPGSTSGGEYKEGTVIFNVAASVARDTANNPNLAAQQLTAQIDVTHPSVNINVPTGTQKKVFEVRVAFSESVTGFVQAELVVSGTADASITHWEPQDGDRNYNATITAAQSGTAIFNVAADVAEDSATNGNTVAAAKTLQVDTELPTVQINVPSTPQNSAFNVTVVFSEAVTGFAQAELVVTGTSSATITSWSPQTGGTNYVATITPTQTGTTIFNVAADVAQDIALNDNTAASEQTVQVDLIRPTVRIDVPSGTQGETFDVAVVFSEPVTGFVQAELVVTGTAGATINNWAPQDGGRNYNAKITAAQSGTAIFNVAANVAEDSATNGNTAATAKTVQIDTELPTVQINVPSTPQNSLFNVTVVFSETVTGFAQAELVVSGTAGASITSWSAQTGGTNYVATITPTQTGVAVFNVAADVAEDSAKNQNTAATQQRVTVDMVRPAVSITAPSQVQGGAFDVTVTFDEPVSGFLQSELSVTGTSGANITNWSPQTGGTNYVATITPTQTGETVFNVAANVAEDGAENLNTAATQQTVQTDLTPPTVRIDVPSGVQGKTFDITVVFSEAVTGFARSELGITGTAGASITEWSPQTGGRNYDAKITAAQSGTAIFNVAADVAQDIALNRNTAAAEQTVEVDLTRPTVRIGVPSTPQNSAFNVTVVFDETVTGFLQSELVVTGASGATITSWSPQTGGTNYIATITPTQTGVAVFNVAADVAEDSAENLNTAAIQQTVQVDLTPPTVRIDVPSGTQGETFDVAIVFSEAVTGCAV